MKLIRVLIKISDNFNESKSKFFSFHAVKNIKNGVKILDILINQL